jgi:hypothetical protein
MWGGYNQPGSGERRDGDRSHVNPVGGSKHRGSEVDERKAIKDERDENKIEHAAQEKQRESEEKQGLAV